jgi:hypothetical protein
MYRLRPLVTTMALGLAAGFSNFAASGVGAPAPLAYNQGQLMQEDRIGPPSQLEQRSESMTASKPVEKESTGQVVTTRPDQNIYQQYGRDSVYGFSPDRKPLKPEQTASRNANESAEAARYVD